MIASPLTLRWHPVLACAMLGIAQLGQVHAIVINDQWFTSSGGNTSNVAATIDAGFSEAREFSFQDQFLPVGAISGCSCTWIGNDAQSNSSLYLTAAHCIESGSQTFPINRTFTDWNGVVRASGMGTGYVPPERINRPPGFGGSATDIALLRLPGQVTILDHDGKPVEQPILYDGTREVGLEVSLAGYGSWGIGSQGSNGGLFPSNGPRRAGGTNIIDAAFEANHALTFGFTNPTSGNATEFEATIASGDSGSAWWQEHAGDWTIIATSCCGGATSYGGGSNGTRVSQYVDWIEGIFPGVRRWSEADPTRVEINSGLTANDQASDVIGQLFTTDATTGAVTYISMDRASSNSAVPDQTYLHLYSDTNVSDGIDPTSFLGSSIASESLNPTNGGLVYWEFDGTSIRLEPNSQYLFAFANSPIAGEITTARVALHNGNGASGYANGFAPVAFSGRTDLNTLFNVFMDTDAITGVVGDVNQDGELDSADIAAFIAGWRSETASQTEFQKILLGDLNLDGLTSLPDAFILHQALKAQGMEFPFSALRDTQVPEPAAISIVSCVLAGTCCWRYYRRQADHSFRVALNLSPFAERVVYPCDGGASESRDFQ